MGKSGGKHAPAKPHGKSKRSNRTHHSLKETALAAKSGERRRKLRRGQHKDFVQLAHHSEDETNSSVNDEAANESPANAAGFLASLDPKQMARTRTSLKAEHRQAKPAVEKLKASKPALPIIAEPDKGRAETEEEVRLADLSEDDFAFGSGASDEDGLSVMSDADVQGSITDLSDEPSFEGLSEDSSPSSQSRNEEWTGGSESGAESDLERAYESRKKRRHLDPNQTSASGLLPIRLPDGTIATHPKTAMPIAAANGSSRAILNASSESDSGECPTLKRDEEVTRAYGKARSDPLGARFGRPAIRAILTMEEPKERLAAAKEEIAALSRDIIASPELGLNHLRRLVSFCPTKFVSKGDSEVAALSIDQPIRALALLSTLAVFLDIVPGYRIRTLTDAEKETRVSQIVLRQREWEDGLVTQYRRYLEVCEIEMQSRSPLQTIAVRCLCTLLEEKTHFNYAVNIMDSIAQLVSQSKWDESSRLCLDAISTVFRKDQTGEDSLHVVRLLSKTIKASNFRVEPALLDVFLNLRLREELGDVRASHHGSDRPEKRTNHSSNGKQAKEGKKPHLSKKARKALKTKAQVRKDIAEAEDEVTKEDKQKFQTETLKLLFALYFRIIKLDSRSPLLPATLEGLARFAHLVNIDFFRDLLDNLKRLMRLQGTGTGMGEQTNIIVSLRERLLCITTAFELLSGQGEALNIDLADFVTELYGLLLPMAVSSELEVQPGSGFDVAAGISSRKRASLVSEADLLFRALHHALFARGRGRSALGPQRARAFGKRILICALGWPARSAQRALDVVAQLVAREPSLEDAVGREDDDEGEDGTALPVDEERTPWWELGELRRHHYDSSVRAAAARMLQGKE